MLQAITSPSGSAAPSCSSTAFTRTGWLLVGLTFLAGCGSEPTPAGPGDDTPAAITISAGDGQTATVNTAVASPIRILVRDISNNPAPGIPVTFAISLGGGITGPTQVTDGSGIATLGSWTLGTAAGANEVTASVDSDPSNLFVLINATATVGAAASMIVSAGDSQSVLVGTAAPVAPAVLVVDAFTNPVAGVAVDFAVVSGSGSVQNPQTTTDNLGVATAGDWLVGSAGTNVLEATTAGLSPVQVVATGTNLSWQSDNNLPGANLSSVWGTAPDNMYSSGGFRTLNHFDGTTWSAVPHPSVNNVYKVHGSSPTNIYAGGQFGILHYDGTAWSIVVACPQECISLWVAPSGDAFTAGDGPIRRFDGVAWRDIAPFPGARVENAWGTSATDVFFVGRGGMILHYDGNTVTSMASGTTAGLVGVGGSSATDVYAVGVTGTILHYDGVAWSPMTSGTSNDIFGVWAASPTNVYAAGRNGTILRYDGVSWSAVPSGTTRLLSMVFGFSPTDIIIAGLTSPASVLTSVP